MAVGDNWIGAILTDATLPIAPDTLIESTVTGRIGKRPFPARPRIAPLIQAGDLASRYKQTNTQVDARQQGKSDQLQRDATEHLALRQVQPAPYPEPETILIHVRSSRAVANGPTCHTEQQTNEGEAGQDSERFQYAFSQGISFALP